MEHEFMLAQKKLHRMTFPAYIQRKFNGVRASLSLEEVETGEGLFKTKSIEPVLRSKGGIIYHMPRITDFVKSLGNDFFKNEETSNFDLVYDGELYIHGAKLNYIKSSCPFYKDGKIHSCSGTPNEVTYVIFDVVNTEYQIDRFVTLEKKLLEYVGADYTLFDTLLNKAPIYFTDAVTVRSKEEAINIAQKFYDEGFEGGILRSKHGLYEHKRSWNLVKIKFDKKGFYTIIDIQPKPIETETAMIICVNDKGATFECNPMGDYALRKEYLDNKHKYIGKKALVKYYELSGVKEVPFHANVVEIIN